MKLKVLTDTSRLLLRALHRTAGELRLRNQLTQKYQNLNLGRNVEIRSPHRLKMGKNVTIESNVLLHCGGMEWSDNKGGITIDDHCYIGPNCVLFGAGEIIIGKNVDLGPGVVIAAQQVDQHGVALVPGLPKFAPIFIEDDVKIASNATVLQGLTIGKGSIISAGTVVTKDVAPYTLLVSGNPRKARTLEEKMEPSQSAQIESTGDESAAQ